jgi:hypothetical protein
VRCFFTPFIHLLFKALTICLLILVLLNLNGRSHILEL